MADKPRVLIVEDDLEILQLIEMYVQSKGVEFASTTSGAKAVELAAKEHFDLVIVDVMLPELDGYHVAQEILDQAGDAPPKIIIMTSRDAKREEGLAKLSGASAIIQKPFRIDELDKVIRNTLGSA